MSRTLRRAASRGSVNHSKAMSFLLTSRRLVGFELNSPGRRNSADGSRSTSLSLLFCTPPSTLTNSCNQYIAVLKFFPFRICMLGENAVLRPQAININGLGRLSASIPPIVPNAARPFAISALCQNPDAARTSWAEESLPEISAGQKRFRRCCR